MKTINTKTKIICTIGPASEKVETMQKLIEKGMDVARLNFSHNTHDKHRQLIKNLRKASKIMGKEIAILQDLQGPKIRIGKVENDAVNLDNGNIFVITTNEIEVGNDKIVSTNHKNLPNERQR